MACKVPRMRPWLISALLLASPTLAPATEPPLPIFDAHLHYSHDAWERLPPTEAVALLRQAGLKAAMVSSSSDDGTNSRVASHSTQFAVAASISPALRASPTASSTCRRRLSTWVMSAAAESAQARAKASALAARSAAAQAASRASRSWRVAEHLLTPPSSG